MPSNEPKPAGESWKRVDQAIDAACKELDSVFDTVPVVPQAQADLQTDKEQLERKQIRSWSEAMRQRLGMLGEGSVG